jgi:hypothetical protein
MEPFVTVPERQKPFDVGSNATRQTGPSGDRSNSWHTAIREKNGAFFQGIVTDSVKRLYQNLCFSRGHPPKIQLASNGNAINNWLQPPRRQS